MIKELEDQIKEMIKQISYFESRDEVLKSIPGVGDQVSRTILAFLPELGFSTRQQIASLVGLATFNHDSGNSVRQRIIAGGRGKVRRVLYQSAVVAVRFCPKMKAFYASLNAIGKASKVALQWQERYW